MKPDGLVPIPLVLDLWSLGHSAGQIAQLVGLPNFRHVARIVARARQIGDPRAVLHCAPNGRLIGRPGRSGKKVRKGARSVGKKEVVPAIGKPLCQAGHILEPAGNGRRVCKVCHREHQRRYRQKEKL